MPIILDVYTEDSRKIYAGYIIHKPVDRRAKLMDHRGVNLDDVDLFTGDLSPINYIGDIDGLRFAWSQTERFGCLTLYGRDEEIVRIKTAELLQEFDLIEIDIPVDKFREGTEKRFPKPRKRS